MGRETRSFCAAELPDDASELLATPSDSDTKRYDLWVMAQLGNPFNRCYHEYCDFKRMFTNLDDNPLPEGDSVLEEIESKMEAMVYYQENKGGYNYYWEKNQLRDSEEWNELRESRKALRALNVESRIPEEPFEQLLYVD